jgi:hypothetical protein
VFRAAQFHLLTDKEKKLRRLEQNRQAAQRSYNKRVALQTEMEETYNALRRSLSEATGQINTVSAVVGKLPMRELRERGSALPTNAGLDTGQVAALGRIRKSIEQQEEHLGSALASVLSSVMDMLQGAGPKQLPHTEAQVPPPPLAPPPAVASAADDGASARVAQAAMPVAKARVLASGD